MTEQIRHWITGVAVTSMISGIALALTPTGKVKKVVELVTGTAVILALIAPVTEFDFSGYSMGLAEYRNNLAAFESGIEEVNNRLSRTIIEEECGAYILDKAQVFGLDISSVRVTVKWGDEGWWYPHEVYIKTKQQTVLPELARVIEADLGIPEVRQYWSGDHEDI